MKTLDNLNLNDCQVGLADLLGGRRGALVSTKVGAGFVDLLLAHDAPTLIIRRDAFERAQLTREAFDRWLNLTPDEFRLEASVIVIGPIYDHEALGEMVAALETKGLAYFDDFIEMSGNLPDWLGVWVGEARK